MLIGDLWMIVTECCAIDRQRAAIEIFRARHVAASFHQLRELVHHGGHARGARDPRISVNRARLSCNWVSAPLKSPCTFSN